MVTYEDLKSGGKFLYYYDSVVPGEEFSVIYAEVSVVDTMSLGKTLHPKVRLENIILYRLRREDEGLKVGDERYVPISQLFKKEEELYSSVGTSSHVRKMVKGAFEDK